DAYEVPTFVIEVISSGDQMEKVREKMLNYRDAGVQVVWHIFPKHRQVDVYSGKKLNEMVTCSGDEICSAAPALPNFKIAAVNIFAKK
ncbi:MAG: Uma2 family endonuclease, partial [Saprospiraceae bacterium]|nr:Uma2 family endonuclease [Saprospiraceae bacterium]